MKTFKLSTYMKGALVILCAITLLTSAMVIINANKTSNTFALYSLANQNSREISHLMDTLYSVRGDLNYLHNDTTIPSETLSKKIRVMNELLRKAHDIANNLSTLPKLSDESRLLAEALHSAFRKLAERYADNLRQLETHNNININNTELEQKFSAAVDHYMEQNEAASYQAQQQAEQDRTRAIWSGMVSITASILLSAFASFWLQKHVFQRLAFTAQTLNAIGRGELFHPFSTGTHNEIGDMLLALKNMQTSLTEMVSKIQNGSYNITSSAGDIETGNSDLSSRTDQQAAALQQTAASMEELRITVKQNADNARHASQLTVHASDVARKGGEVMTNVIHTMHQITESSRRIADINAVIDSIANQTNILALNAAVEAARAGEQGRGFAVVASEVRNLAKRSSDAAKEISSLISHSVNSVNDGASLVEKAGETIEGIVISVAQVSDIMNEITFATEEQSTGIDQIAQAINEMDLVTQQNASLVQQVAAVSSTMSLQASTLKDSVSIFQTSEQSNTVILEPKGVYREKLLKTSRTALQEVKTENNEEWDTF